MSKKIMIAPKTLPPIYDSWNKKWGSPYGYDYRRYRIPIPIKSISNVISKIKLLDKIQVTEKLLGMFAFQGNSGSRIFEYPWAYYATSLKKGMRIIDIGGGFSGFQFVLSKEGLNVTNIDPGDPKHKWTYHQERFNQLNKVFGTSVKLFTQKIEDTNIDYKSIDRVFCISVLEHISEKDRNNIMKSVHKILKNEGLFIITVDLFLDLMPFSNKINNENGKNISIYQLITNSGFKLAYGKPSELFGYPSFSSKLILSNLSKYFISNTYPLVTQVFVLKKI